MAIGQEGLIARIAEMIEAVTGIEPAEVTVEKSFVDDRRRDSRTNGALIDAQNHV